MCSKSVNDYIEFGIEIPYDVDEFEIKRTLSILAGSELTSDQIDRFMQINDLLSKEELDIREELILPRFIFETIKGLNYVNPELASCRDVRTKIFFSTKGGDRAKTIAKNICRTCPEIDNCLKTALENNEDGIWGGTTKSERIELLRVKDK